MQKEQSFKASIGQDFIQMTILMLASVVAVYKSPSFVRDAFFLVPLYLAFKSKKDYFWFAYFFLLLQTPVYFFITKTQADLFRLPFYTIANGLSFTVSDLFLFVSLYKAYKSTEIRQFFFSKPLGFFIYYILFLSIPVSMVIGVDFGSFMNSLRSFFYYGFIFSFVKLIKDPKDIILFGYLLAPFCIGELVDQFHYLVTEKHLIQLMESRIEIKKHLASVSGGVRILPSGLMVMFYTIIFGGQIQGNKKYELFRGLGGILMLIVFLSFVLSNTRAWLTMAGVAIILFNVISGTLIKTVLQSSILVVLLISIVFYFGWIDFKFLEGVFERYSVVFNIIGGGTEGLNDYRNLDTFADRINNDIPRVLEAASVSPVIGVGLSRVYFENYSSDVGFVNTILTYGYIGFIFFLGMFLKLIYKLNQERKKVKKFNFLERRLLSSVFVAFSAIIVGYITTWDFFTFFPWKIFTVALLLGIADNVYSINSNRLSESTE